MALRTIFSISLGSALVLGATLAGCGDDTGTGGTGAGGNPPAPCEAATECPKSPCELATCTDGVCGTEPKPDGTAVDIQTGGDCKLEVCDGAGALRFEVDSTDVPTNDLDSCEVGTCEGELPGIAPAEFGSECNGDGFCNANGDCVQCIENAMCESMVCNQDNGECAPVHCGSSVLDGNETDVDCGGSCARCADGLKCNEGNDCQSDVCEGGECQVPTCKDGERNGTETDEDCGGDCPACALGNNCMVGADCSSTICKQGVCGQVNDCDPTSSVDLTGQAEVAIAFGGTDGNNYNPRCVRVSEGTVITFNGDFSLHPFVGGEVVNGVKAQAASGPFVPATSSGMTKDFTASAEGNYGFYCEIHAIGGMNGAVFVEP